MMIKLTGILEMVDLKSAASLCEIHDGVEEGILGEFFVSNPTLVGMEDFNPDPNVNQRVEITIQIVTV